MNNRGYYEIGINAQYLREMHATTIVGNVIMNRLHWHDHLEVICCVHGSFSVRVDGSVK